MQLNLFGILLDTILPFLFVPTRELTRMLDEIY